jgi:hypothetical protein
MTAGDRLLRATAPRALARAATSVGGDAVGRIEAALPRALAGERSQVRMYVDAYRDLTARILEAVGQVRPDLVVLDGAHRVAVLDPRGRRGASAALAWINAALDQEAISVPFSGWVATFGVGEGTAGAVAAAVRTVLPRTTAPAPPNGRLPEWRLDERQVVRFSRAVLDEIARDDAPLDHIGAVLGTSQTELAALFGVRRQALDQWRTRGIPSERQEKVATLGAIADLLAARLKRERIPGVVRRPAAGYGGRSALEAIAAGDEQRVLEELRHAFDWAAAA